MSQISNDNRRDGARIAEWIALVGRQQVGAVMAHFEMPQAYAQRCMRAALLDGLLSKARIGRAFMWATPGDIDAIRFEQRKARTAYGTDRYRRLRAAGVIDHKGSMLDPEHWPVVQRVVPAAGAKPLATRAPASVFHLGAML